MIYEHTEAALAATGLPVFLGGWVKNDDYPTVPPLYLAYRRLVSVPELGADDLPRLIAHYMRVDVYANRDPTDEVGATRAALVSAGFLPGNERDLDDVEIDLYHTAIDAVYYEEVYL